MILRGLFPEEAKIKKSEAVLAEQHDSYERMLVACPLAEVPPSVTLLRHGDVVGAVSAPTQLSSVVLVHRMVSESSGVSERAVFRTAIHPNVFPSGRERSHPACEELRRT